MNRHDDASDADYEQLRRHLLGPRLEHPAGRQQPRAPVVRDPRPETQDTQREERAAPPRLSVMAWLVAVGQAAARKLRGTSRSPIARLHPRR
jgi:hypothetical protein